MVGIFDSITNLAKRVLGMDPEPTIAEQKNADAQQSNEQSFDTSKTRTASAPKENAEKDFERELPYNPEEVIKQRILGTVQTGAPALDLNKEMLTTLPDNFGELTRLEHLFVSHNQLTTLPDSLGQLTQLREFDVSSNQLEALPESIIDII